MYHKAKLKTLHASSFFNSRLDREYSVTYYKL